MCHGGGIPTHHWSIKFFTLGGGQFCPAITPSWVAKIQGVFKPPGLLTGGRNAAQSGVCCGTSCRLGIQRCLLIHGLLGNFLLMGALTPYLPSICHPLLLTSAHTGGGTAVPAVPAVCGTSPTIRAIICLICWTTSHAFFLTPPDSGHPTHLPFPELQD